VGTGAGQYNLTGAVMLATYTNTGQSDITVRDLTADGNQANVATPGSGALAWAGAPESSPVALWNASNVTISGIRVINAVGYSIYPANLLNFRVMDCDVLTGQGGTAYGVQDGIHLCAFSSGKGTGTTQYGTVSGNIVDTGTGVAGDDGIAFQSYGLISDIVISNNVIRSAQAGIALYLSNSSACTVTNITITGNNVWETAGGGTQLVQDVPPVSGSLISNVTIAGNTYSGIGLLQGSATTNAGVMMPNTESATTAWWQGVSITGNTFRSFGTGYEANLYGIYAPLGSYLTITGNTFVNYPGTNAAIQVGDTNMAVTQFAVAGNQANCTTSNAVGVFVADSSHGTVSGNVMTGAGGSLSAGVLVQGTGVAPVGVIVTGNQVSNFSTAMQEYNNGVQPDSNMFNGNSMYGCSFAPVVISGLHTTMGGQKFIQTTTATTGGTGTASQNITGLVVSLNIGAYYLEVQLPWLPTGTIASTTTFGFSASGLTLSAISMASLINSATTTAEAGTSALVTSTTLSDAMWTSPTRAGTGGYGMVRLWGTLTVSAAGTLQAVFANTTSADTSTFAAGASILVRPLS
jgi:hypothetical protein